MTVCGISSYLRMSAHTMALPIATNRNGRNHLSRNGFMGVAGFSTAESPCEVLWGHRVTRSPKIIIPKC